VETLVFTGGCPVEIKREGDNDSTEFPQADKPTAGMFCFCSAHSMRYSSLLQMSVGVFCRELG